MKNITRIVVHYTDGTQETIYGNNPLTSAPMPLPAPYWTTKKCPKCGINCEGTMGYVCQNSPCPMGMGSPTCHGGLE